MMPERWQRLEDLFHAMLQLPAESRAGALAAACGDDVELLAEVQRLLQAEAHASAFVDGAAAGLQRVAATVVPEGAHIGAYRIVRELGRGGMGTVYLGERSDAQFEMHVAIKVIKRGMDTDAVLQRFHHEQQILAGLEHPNIARLLDGGTTGEGLPYFVMEYVDGQPIDEYCRTLQVPIDQRLRIFRQVCAAVSYAHQHLVVHRDIKPSNILVTADGVPKLVDFGIAKLLAGENGSTVATEFGAQAMTPQYASPEQLRGERVTTASDVYALGVLLYELLTGARPYDVTDKSPAESRLIVVDAEVAKPSVTAARRGDDVLARRLRGDLDSIVITAIHKDPAERYGSVAPLDDDIRRHMDRLPVLARGDSWTYRTVRFVRRHKLGVAAAAAIVFFLVGGIITTSWQARVARAERARAERHFNDVRKLANSVMFDYHDAIEALPGATAVRERLVKDALAYLDSLAAEAGGDPALQRELAAGYDRMGTVLGRTFAANLGDTKGAIGSYQKALRIREALVAADPMNPQARRELADSYRHLGWLESDSAAGVDHFRQAVAIHAQLLEERPGDIEGRIGLARAYNELGTALEDRSDFAGALENERRALSLLEEVSGAASASQELRRLLSTTHDYMGRSLFLTGDVTAALESNARALELRVALAAQYPTDATLRRMLAISYQMDADIRDLAGDFAGALASFRRKLAMDEELLAADPANAQAHGDFAYSHERLGDILAKRGAHAEALPHYRSASDEWERGTRNGNMALAIRLAMTRAGVARAEASLGHRSAALDAIRRAEAAADQAPDDPSNSGQRGSRAQAYGYLADAYVALATRPGTVPAADAKAHWSAACRMYQRSADVWDDMRRRGILAGNDASKTEAVARELDHCKTRLEGK